MTREFGRDYSPYSHATYSRYELAVALAGCLTATEAALDDLVGDDVGPAAEVHARTAAESRGTVLAFVKNGVALERLEKEFQVELKQLGAADKWSSRLSRRTTTGRVSDLFEVDQKTVSALEPEIGRLMRAVNLTSYPSERSFGRCPVSSWEAAVAIHASLTMARDSMKEFEKGSSELAWNGWGPKAEARTKKVADALTSVRGFAVNKAAFDRMFKTFEWELAMLGVDARDVSQISQRVVARAPHLHMPRPGEVYMAFPDVPQDHWASHAVSQMRMQGILRGQPDGRFGG